ncbi:hypothetical protein [Bradyrhizobium sp. BWC-3-1]|uniref:hypothetical protein n=2 Tax=unclassified Bradyrhizobium TaxID=2631580 RepID=UPI00293F18ED|nr:hypothetical protein [Bradyrhizobium sp. BWC-3-1]WOH57844.1 hypothetical protein RX329_37915 [Bradyrhizobium sp. BWC-3-1]
MNDLRIEDEAGEWFSKAREGVLDQDSVDRWHEDGTFDRMAAEHTMFCGALQLIASEMIGQSTQKAAGSREFHDGLREYQQVREHSLKSAVGRRRLVRHLRDPRSKRKSFCRKDLRSMPAYLVRLIKNQDIVGFFSAADLEELAEAVDECTDVPYCEYLELPSGGIMWTSPATALPLKRGNEDEGKEAEQIPWVSAELSEGWWDGVYGYREEDWIAFDPHFTEQPDPPFVGRQMGPGNVIPLKGRKRGQS